MGYFAKAKSTLRGTLIVVRKEKDQKSIRED